MAGVACLGAAIVVGTYFRAHLLIGGSAPSALLLATAIVALALVLAAGPMSRRLPRLSARRAAPRPWLVAIVALAVAAAWSMLLRLPAPPIRSLWRGWLWASPLELPWPPGSRWTRIHAG